MIKPFLGAFNKRAVVPVDDAEELREAGEPLEELPEPAGEEGEAFLASLFSDSSLADDSS